MLIAYFVHDRTLQKKPISKPAELVPGVRWLDLYNPTEQERQWVRQAYGQEVLFIEELGEIEATSRYYRDEHGMHLHVYFLHLQDRLTRNVDVAFTVNKGRLYTLHAEEIPALRAYYTQASTHPELPDDAFSILLSIIDMRTGLLADTYERLQNDLEGISSTIFSASERGISNALETLARITDINGKAQIGLMENQRVFTNLQRGDRASQYAEQINDTLRDVESLMAHSNLLFERAKFLMDTALGMINLQHSRRLNIFTVLTVVLMPPTLIASIYGMNFKHMPELNWSFGYPYALIMMLIVAVGPILYLKYKDWL